jgi:hypothetical protein
MSAVVGLSGDCLAGLNVDAEPQNTLCLSRRLAQRLALGHRNNADVRDGLGGGKQSQRGCAEKDAP